MGQGTPADPDFFFDILWKMKYAGTALFMDSYGQMVGCLIR